MGLAVTAKILNSGVYPNQCFGIDALAVTPAGTHEQGGRNSIGTSEESIAISADIATNGYAIVINRDATNFVQLGTATGVYWAKLLPGQAALVPIDPSVTSLFLKADTAACEVEYRLFEA